MQTDETLVYPIISPCWPAIVWARMFYRQHSDLDFDKDLEDYLTNGFVWSRPTLFAMAKVINYKGDPAFFVRMAVGDLVELLTVIPGYLPRVCFHRNNKGKMRVYQLDRLATLAVRIRMRRMKYGFAQGQQ